MRLSRALGIAGLMLVLGVTPCLAMAPPFPENNITSIADGQAEPFVGTWSLVLPAGRPDEADTVHATCDRPVRIEAADERHIFYIGPYGAGDEAATELVSRDGRTWWEPIAGGPHSFAIWTAPDRFHLYDTDVATPLEWAQPLVYTRCR